MDKWFCVGLRWAAIVNGVCGIIGSILLFISISDLPKTMQDLNDVARFVPQYRVANLIQTSGKI